MKKAIIVLALLFGAAAAGCVVWFAHLFSPGSYPYAEQYEIEADEQALTKAIRDFKSRHPIYDVPDQAGLTDGRRDSSDYWYHIYFYFPEEHKIVSTWTRPSGRNKTTFALVAINDGLTLGNWHMFNKDLSRKDDRFYKTKFKKRILDSLKILVEQ